MILSPLTDKVLAQQLRIVPIFRSTMTAVETEPVHNETVETFSTAPTQRQNGRPAKRVERRGPFAVLRSILFWSHLVMGTVGGVIILVMSVTGALLGFERQMIARFDGVAQVVPPSPTASRLPLDSMLAIAGIAAADVAGLTVKAGRTEPVSVRFRERERTAQLLDPYTGATVDAVPRGKMAASMSWLRGWHRWLGATGESRPLMRKITGACNLAFLLLVFTGLYIWWPKRLSKAAFKTAAVFNPKLGGKARDFNWHNSLGFWSAIPLALVIATGAFISYQWPGQWMDRLFGSEKERAAAIKAMNTPPVAEGAAREGAAREGGRGEAPRAEGGRGGRQGGGAVASQREGRGNEVGSRAGAASAEAPAPRNVAPLAGMLTAVVASKPEWKSLTITTAAPRDSVVQFAVAEGNTYRPDLKSQYFFDASTGAQTRVTNFDSLSTSRKIRGWTRFGHTGEVFGLTGQSIATFVSVVGAILVWTGLALAWRRLVAFLKRRKREAIAV